jgi:hypothetical protein
MLFHWQRAPATMRLLTDSIVVPGGDAGRMELAFYRRDERGTEESQTLLFHPVKRNGW